MPDVAALNALEIDVREQVRRCAPGANAVTKEILLASRRLDRDVMLDKAAASFAGCLLGAEAREGIAAFLEKRKPAWVESDGNDGSMNNFKSILVANRGEIAVRVMRTAKSLGYRTIAVYSDADAGAPHVTEADDAFLLGRAPSAESYLNIERILAAAAATGAEAIHPGYGFLSENAAFAAGRRSRGPRVHRADTRVDPPDGQQGGGQATHARSTGAVRAGLRGARSIRCNADGRCRPHRLPGHGQGCRGRRWPRHAAGAGTRLACRKRCEAARSEAKNAFGSDELILEKAILRPGTSRSRCSPTRFGNTMHLGERDCSVQRRHQKVVEEAPCPVMTPQLRDKMGASAVEAARSIGYRGAGTVEFLLDRGRGRFISWK